MYCPYQDALGCSVGHIAQDAEHIHLYHYLAPSSETELAEMKCELRVLVGRSCTRSSTALTTAGCSAQQDRWACLEAARAIQYKVVILFV